jgi:NAD(P)-dependent dehydrogenase (short-subunit alcohol dehydrogenase family)
MTTEKRTRTALVTGGNRGIGLAVCRQLGTLGYRVLLTGRNRELAEAAADRLRQEGAQVLARVLDVTDADSIHDLPQPQRKSSAAPMSW